MVVAQESNASIRRCAFCKYWYDPTNSAISPKGACGRWELNPNIKKICRMWNIEKISWSTCKKFEFKL